MKIGLLLEDRTNDVAVKSLVRLIHSVGSIPGVEVRKLRGHGNILNRSKVEGVIRSLLAQHPDTDKVLAMVDQDCKPERRQQANDIEGYLLTSGINPPPRYCMVVQAFEGWLIADQAAVSKVLGRSVPTPLPEYECDPKGWLRKTFHKFKKPFNLILVGQKIVDSMNLERVAQRNPSFHEFRRLVEDP